MDYNLFEEVLKGLCYFDQCEPDSEEFPPPGVADEECRNGNSDIPGGFQDIPPQLFILIAEIVGNAIAGKIPFNVQNALGNWLELVGQVILTANAQQQYFMNGPGRFYNPIYRNSGNPFCQSSGTTADDDSNVTKKNTSTTKSSDNTVQKKIDELVVEIEMLKEEIKKIKNS